MSRLLDGRGRIFGLVNVVDVIVLILIVAVVVFALVRTSGETSKTFPIVVTYTVEEVRQATVGPLVAAMQAKATVRDDGGTVLGTVEQATVAPVQEEVPTAQGEVNIVESPLFRIVDLRVRGQATRNGAGYRIGSLAIHIGQKVNVVGPKFMVQATVTKLEEE